MTLGKLTSDDGDAQGRRAERSVAGFGPARCGFPLQDRAGPPRTGPTGTAKLAPMGALSNPLRRLLTGLAALAILGIPEAGTAQHGMDPLAQERALHRRLPQADAVVLASVVRIDPGRIGLEGARPVAGGTPVAFELKRSPSRPPKVEVGDRVLLLLRGAREPYVLADDPRLVVRIPAGEEPLWTEAVERAVACGEAPECLVDLYSGWIEQGPASLRELGFYGLGDRTAPFQPLSGAFLSERAEWAAGSRLPLDARLAFARLVARDPAGSTALARALTEPSNRDPRLVQLALSGAAAARSEAFAPLVTRALRADDPAIRRSAAQVLGLNPWALDPPLLATLRRAAHDDPAEPVRGEARTALARLGQAHDGAGGGEG